MNADELNPGIRGAVLALREAGFDTQDSGDGETHAFGCDRPNPYVVIRVDPDHMRQEADRLAGMFRVAGAEVGPLGPDGYIGDTVNIHADYDPADGFAFLNVASNNLTPWRKLEGL